MTTDQYGEIKQDLGEIKGILRSWADLPARVTELEKWQSRLKGGLGVVGIVTAAMLKPLKWFGL